MLIFLEVHLLYVTTIHNEKLNNTTSIGHLLSRLANFLPVKPEQQFA